MRKRRADSRKVERRGTVELQCFLLPPNQSIKRERAKQRREEGNRELLLISAAEQQTTEH